MADRVPWVQRLGLGRREQRAWAMYDWANSAFVTTVVAALLPVYYSDVAASHLPNEVATAYWGYSSAIALGVVAILSPSLGAMADYLGAKKHFLAVFLGFGVTFTALLYFVGEGQWALASFLFIVAYIGFSGANVFYEALLPSIALDSELDQVSTAGFAIGYLGGGILLAMNAIWFLFPEAFGFADGGAAVRASFLSVAVWWALFSVPLFRRVPEPSRRLVESEAEGMNPIQVGFSRVWKTLHEIRGHRDLFFFLLAFLVYNDGVGTIVKMASIYGVEVGIGRGHLIGALLLVQFAGVPFTFGFGRFATRVSQKTAIYLCLVVYTGVAALGYFMTTAWQFWVLALAVAVVQGGVSGLSRSVYASMIPAGRATEFFGFYSVSSKLAGIAGPLVFGVVGQSTGSSRFGILSLVGFFVVGGVLLTRVDIGAGRRAARQDEESMAEVTG